MNEQQRVFHVEGMHCAACEFLLEESCCAVPDVQHVKASLRDQTLVVTTHGESDALMSDSDLAQALTEKVAHHGYRITTSAQMHTVHYREFLIAIPAALAFILAFSALQRLGIVNVVSTGTVTLGTAFLLGLIASVSTCLAIVGGLVLSLSARAAQQGGRWQQQALFHGGRLVGFFVLGAAIGALGSVVHLGFLGTIIVSIAVGVVMLMLGINLLDVFPHVRRLQLRLPKAFAKRTTALSASSHALAPIVVGGATFFLPCGFTQSMQLYALSLGNPLASGMTMFAFALGTFPVLALLSFGSINFAQKPWKGTFFKAAGIVIIALALVSIVRSAFVLWAFIG